MNFTGVNFLAILVAGVLHMILGFLWYGPLFSKPWMKLTGMTEQQASQGGPGPAIYLVPFVGALFGFYVLALFIDAAQAYTLAGGALTGLLAGVGILASFSAANAIFSNKPLQLFLIDYGYPVLSLVIAGALLGIWR
jgi:hypothetical protein